jgi:hypothetical protein
MSTFVNVRQVSMHRYQHCLKELPSTECSLPTIFTLATPVGKDADFRLGQTKFKSSTHIRFHFKQNKHTTERNIEKIAQKLKFDFILNRTNIQRNGT